MCDERFVLVAVESLLASRQRLSGVDNDRRLTRVMIVLCNRVHGAVGVGSFPVDALYSAVAYSAAIVPGNFRTHWNRLERSFLRCSHDASPCQRLIVNSSEETYQIPVSDPSVQAISPSENVRKTARPADALLDY